MELGDFEKKIYNIYLKTLGEKQGRPYMSKKDFSNMTESMKTTLKRLKMFFETYKDVNPLTFFRAGFKGEDKNFLELSYFTSLRASKLYAKYIKEKYMTSVDNEESIKDFKEGIIFIYDFMRDNDFTLNEYLTSLNESGVPWFIIHLKRQNISFYHIHALEITLDRFPIDWRELLVKDFENVFFSTKKQFDESSVMKKIGTKLNSFIKRERKLIDKK